jgi:hypothetical protein
MTIYAVHSPALEDDPVRAFDRAKLLRLGFARWAFVFGPLWLIASRLWLALVAWCVGAALVGLAVARGALAQDAAMLFYWLSALYLGFEGRALQGWSLTRRGLPLADIVTADTKETAERGFLARALAAPRPAPGPRVGATPAPDPRAIIGLFPRAGG